MSQKAAIRRRKQSAKNFTHLAKLGRPIYHKMTAARAAKKLAKKLNKIKAMAMRKGMSKR